MTEKQERKLRLTIGCLIIKAKRMPDHGEEFDRCVAKWTGFIKDAIEDDSLSKET